MVKGWLWRPEGDRRRVVDKGSVDLRGCYVCCMLTQAEGDVVQIERAGDYDDPQEFKGLVSVAVAAYVISLTRQGIVPR